MRDLYKLTWKEASADATEEIIKRCGVSTEKATLVLKNCLIYNCVIDEIVGQAMFLLGKEEE